MDYFETQISKVDRLEQDYVLLRFKGDRPVSGKPGQFVMVRGDWGTDPVLPRAFSIVEIGKAGAVLVRAVGKGTELLCAMKEGDALFVLGPIGQGFPDPDEDEKPVLVAGGVGVAPLVFLAEKLADSSSRPICIYGARTSLDLPLLSKLETLCDVAVTTEDGSAGEKGMVTDPLARVIKSEKRVHVFSCGPTPMLEAVAAKALEADLPCHIAMESPMACGMGTCKGCALSKPNGGFVYVCCEGPVFNAREVFGDGK
jgi:dihydroorotate dehydrogenase electron transfer subunit